MNGGLKEMTKYVRAMLAVGTALGAIGTASGQAIPNYGNFNDLDGTFRVGVAVTNALNNFNDQDAFDQTEIDGIIDYLDPAELSTRLTPFNVQTAAIDAVFDIRGAFGRGGYAQNSPVLNIRVVLPDGNTFVNKRGETCSFTYNGQNRQASFDLFDAAVDDENSPTSRALLSCLTGALVRSSPVDPLAGNPGSLQSSLARGALDLASGDSAIEEQGADGANAAGDPWIVGASYGFGNAGRFDLSRVDARIARGFRVGEGGRSRLKFDLPFSYTRINGTAAYTGQVAIGLEMPIGRNFSIEPRIGYGATGSAEIGQVGHIAQGSVSARYVLAGLGRGRLVLGAMGGYSQTLGTPFTDLDLDPGLKNGVFRGGAAYETPIQLRAGGRSLSVRGSYSYTQYTGDDLYNNNFHEFTVSAGLRTREEQVRGLRDVVRFNVSTIQASGYEQYTFGLGFRF